MLTARLHMHIHMHTHMHTHTHTHIYACTSMHAHTHICMHAQARTHTHCMHSHDLINYFSPCLFILVWIFHKWLAPVGKPFPLFLFQYRGTGQAWVQWTLVWWQWAAGTATSGDHSLQLSVLFIFALELVQWCSLSCCGYVKKIVTLFRLPNFAYQA